ncbi:hypothetical protein E2K80_15005 [Rhodophyticola sp. CCM32]|uniref:SRPBCC family protein n=1 Tax=Rhodophyticola sp. CCM32 TaxID=2916397 RepID=UPI00107FB1E4|nr:SRPBCC family protein [Rhodophyticola sp. CCM32]QBY01873.1 hypothetical protein E2K80_15005 [Rhodophyticola sp. CCM32]
MRLIRNILIGLVILIAVLAAGAYLLPRHVIIERQITIDAPPGDVFPLVNSLQRGEEWSPWLDRDPNVQITHSGPEAGVGAIMEWVSDVPEVGNGRQEIVESVADQRVATALDFGGMGTARAWFDLTGDGESTNITWGLDADMGNNPIGRWMGLMMDGMVGADYETGLANLKTLAEAG